MLFIFLYLKNMDILSLCQKFFKNCKIKTDHDGEYLLYKIYTNDNLCLVFTIIDNKTIEIIKLKRCFYSGKNTLNNLELLSKHIGIKYLKLEDQSKVTWYDHLDITNGIDIDFALLNIMVKGESYYNSLGYYQRDYFLEKTKWDNISNETFFNYLEYIQTLDYNSYENVYSHFF